jgi:hypothetical protein
LEEEKMKKLMVLLIGLCFTAYAFGAVDIQFSPGGGTPGNWIYDGDVTLSFTQIVDIDVVLGGTTDTLFNERVFVPDLILSSGYTVVTPSGPLEIKDSGGNVLLSGTLANGDFASLFTTAVLYTQYTTDFTVTSISNTIVSDFLDTLSIGSKFDFNLTIQGNENFADILGDGNEHSNGFSGSMTVIPEPATMCLFALGGLLLRKRKIN